MIFQDVQTVTYCFTVPIVMKYIWLKSTKKCLSYFKSFVSPSFGAVGFYFMSFYNFQTRQFCFSFLLWAVSFYFMPFWQFLVPLVLFLPSLEPLVFNCMSFQYILEPLVLSPPPLGPLVFILCHFGNFQTRQFCLPLHQSHQFFIL